MFSEFVLDHRDRRQKGSEVNTNDAGATAGKHTKRKRGAMAALTITLCASAVSLGVSSQPAAASAFGCSYYRPISTPWGTPNVNSYCAALDGSGTWVNYVSGSFTSNVGTLCNYNIQLSSSTPAETGT